MAMYELFMLGRKNGMIALEEHVGDPASKPHFEQIPLLHQKQGSARILL